MTDIKVHGWIYVDGKPTDYGVADLGKALDDVQELEEDNEGYIIALLDAWAETASILDQRDEARGIAGTLYLVAKAAFKAFNAEPYGEEQYQKDARRELWNFLATTPKWIQELDE